MSTQESEGSSSSGGKSRQKVKPGSDGAPRPFDGECNNCGVVGHRARDCRSRKVKHQSGRGKAATRGAKKDNLVGASVQDAQARAEATMDAARELVEQAVAAMPPAGPRVEREVTAVPFEDAMGSIVPRAEYHWDVYCPVCSAGGWDHMEAWVDAHCASPVEAREPVDITLTSVVKALASVRRVGDDMARLHKLSQLHIVHSDRLRWHWVFWATLFAFFQLGPVLLGERWLWSWIVWVSYTLTGVSSLALLDEIVMQWIVEPPLRMLAQRIGWEREPRVSHFYSRSRVEISFRRWVPRSLRDLRADGSSLRENKHADAMYAEVWHTVGLSHGRSKTVSRLVSFELLSQITLPKNMDVRATAALTWERLWHTATTVQNLNVDRYATLEGHSIVQDTVAVAFAQWMALLEMRHWEQVPRLPAA